MSTYQKIKEIEEEVARTQKNKATEYHLGQLKAKLAKLKREITDPTSSAGGQKGEGFDVARSGDCRVGFVGFPSVGKSTLVSKLTGIHSEAAAYEFTTLTCVPGILYHKGAKIQMLDLPGIIEGAKDGKGRGKQVIAVARTCNLIYIVLDVTKPVNHKQIIERELEGLGIRLNKKPPNVVFKRKDKGGINFTTNVPLTNISFDLIKSVMAEYRIHNADILVKEDITVDDFIDVIENHTGSPRVYIPCIYVLNKIDAITIEELDIIMRIPHCVPISAEHKWNYGALLDKTWAYLSLVRVYTKPKGTMPDFSEPVVLKPKYAAQCTIEHLCIKLHKTLIKDFKYALVWGTSTKHNPQKVGRDHVVHDEDVVQIVKKI